MPGDKENPYLAHLHPAERSKSTANGASTLAAKEPLFGFIPRKITGAQVRKAMVRSSMCYGGTLRQSVLMAFSSTGT